MPENFQILITADATKAVGEAKAAQEALKQVGSAGDASGKETSAAADKSTGKFKDLKKSLSELGREFPVLGALGRVMFNPIALGAAAATLAIRRIKADVAALNETLTASDFQGYGNSVAARKKDFEAAAQGASAFAREMERIEAATETASAASERLMTVFKAQQDAQDKLDEARKRMEIAQVEAGEKDPVRKQQKLLEIEERYAARKREREDGAARFELEQQRKKMENERAAVGSLDKQLAGAREKQDGLKSEAQIQKEIETTQANLAATEAERDKKRTRLEQLEQTPWLLRSTPQEHEMGYLRQQLDELDRTEAAQRRLLSKQEAAAPGRIDEWRSGQENISMLEDMRRGAAQRANGIAAMLPTQERVNTIERETRAEAGTMDSIARMAQAAARGGAEQQRLADEATKQFERTGQVAQRSVDLWRRQADLNAHLLDVQKRLESQLANQRTR